MKLNFFYIVCKIRNMAKTYNAKYFLDIPDIDLPPGTPVVGYKLFYRSAMSPTVLQRIVHGTSITNADNAVRGPDYFEEYSCIAEEEVQKGLLVPIPGQEGLYVRKGIAYNEDAPNVMTDSIKKDVGFFYWPDRALAEEYAQWYSEEYVRRDFYGIPDEAMRGRYELHRVEGIHVPKPLEDPFEQGMNEGMTMNEMVIDKEVLAAWSMVGDRIDEKQSMRDWVAQEQKRVDEWNKNKPATDYSEWW